MTAGDSLLQALRDAGDPPLRPLPDQAARLLQDLDAPARLAAHLRLALDDILTSIGNGADQRLEFQARYPLRTAG